MSEADEQDRPPMQYVRHTFSVCDEMPADLQLMAIWNEAYTRFKGHVSGDKMMAAANWLREWVRSDVEGDRHE